MSILQSLSSIVQRVNAAPDLQSALNIIVRDVRRSMGTEVCTVYMADHLEERLIFRATEGLNAEAIGEASLAFGAGLVGQVALREEVINTSNAPDHPHFQYLEEIGEDPFNSFLGVPIVHHRTVLGVLVVQQKDSRRFDESEEAFLLTMSAQLASVIAHAQATGMLDVQTNAEVSNAEFRGVAGASGVAIGQAVVIAPPADLYGVPSRVSRDIYEELVFFRACVARVRKDLKQAGDALSDRLPPEELALFDVYSKMLDKQALPAEIELLIEAGEWAQGAVARVMRSHLEAFDSMDNAYLKERAVDVKDLGRRLLEYLQQANQEPMIYPEKTILVGSELTASMLAEVPRNKLAGLISLKGSRNSHVAILARSMGVPTVMGAVDLPFTKIEGSELIVDGFAGLVYFNPSLDLRASYEQIDAEEKLVSKGLEALKDLTCETLDGHKIALWVNTGLASDVNRSLDRGAEGVGLYRTEVPFLMRDRFPSEEEQRAVYRMHLEAFAPSPVTMRTLDVGGDKPLPYFSIEEENPFLGWRGIRLTLDHPEIFLPQVRAMMKASLGIDNLRIMLPMITHIDELEEARALIERAHAELLEEGIDVDLPPIGAMIEVPAAVHIVTQVAAKVDFLSVGSNDLTQYLLAVDRNNPNVADLYHSYHPAVLRALQQIALAAGKAGKPLSICGEMAGDPGAAMLLVAMGYDSLSMNATNLPKVKSIVRSITKEESDQLLDDVMQMTRADDVKIAIANMLDKKRGDPIVSRPGAGQSFTLVEWLVYLLLGGFAGLLAGLFGVGGGAIVVPILILVFNFMGIAPELVVHLALGTSFATIVVTSVSSVLAHQQYRTIDWIIWRMLSPGLVLGVFIGAAIAIQIDGRQLQMAIAIFFMVIALQMLTRVRPKHWLRVRPDSWLQSVAGIIIGLVSAFFGIGGGSLTVPWLTAIGEPIKKAVATSAACGLPIAVVGSLSYALLGGSVFSSEIVNGAEPTPDIRWRTGYVYWPAFVGIALTSVPMAKLGARWANLLPEVMMRRLFVLLLMLISVQLLFSR